MNLAEARYDVIAPLFENYHRRFSVLDLGAGINPYMAQRISREFDAVVTCIEKNEIVQTELDQFGPNVMWLKKDMGARDLERLSYCEHFDVVLALNALHHFGDYWQDAALSLTTMCDWLIAQTPLPSDKGTCGQDIVPEIYRMISQIGVKIGETVQFEGHDPRPIFRVEGSWRPKLTMSSWTSPENCINAEITSDFSSKTIWLRHKQNAEPRPYIHGMNLWNFAQLGGAWPRRSEVVKLIREFPLPDTPHGDITAHNFLFDGAALHLIDGHEGWEFDDADGLRKTVEQMGFQ